MGGVCGVSPVYGPVWLISNNLCEVILKIFQVSLNSLHGSSSIAFGKSTSHRIYPEQHTP